MTAFYAPLRGMQAAIDHVVMLDSQLVELRRVMDAAPQTYNRLLKESIELSDQLGNKVTDVQQAMNEFGRQGYDESTLVDLTKTATVADNISNLKDTSEAVSILTAGMQAYGIEASKSMSIMDKLNEVDKLLSLVLATMQENREYAGNPLEPLIVVV